MENVNVNLENPLGDIFDVGDNVEKQVNGNFNKPKFNEDNYLNTKLDSGEFSKEIRIRIVLTPDIDGKNKVAIPIKIHNLMLNSKQQQAKLITKNSKFKSFICLNDKHLSNKDERGCPLCNKMKELFNEANTIGETDKNLRKALCQQAYKFESKTAYIVRCIERGKEDEGIKFWRFNKRDDGAGPFDVLKGLAYQYKTELNVDLFDYIQGHDLVLTLTKDPDPTPGAPEKTAITIKAALKSTPLSDNQEQINAWVNDEKDWRDMYRSKSFDYLSIVADGESPVWDKDKGKFVVWVDSEELKKRNQDIEQTAAEELKPTVVLDGTNETEIDSELPF